MKVIVEISKTAKKWSEVKLINKNLIKKVVKNILDRFANLKKIKRVELSILLTDDNNMMYLNEKFREKKTPTNVLSFPAQEFNWEQLLNIKINLDYLYLGDIAFGYNIIVNEAECQKKKLEEHFIHLLVHSILHLIGFDHEYEKDAVIMEQLEEMILKDFSINYIN